MNNISVAMFFIFQFTCQGLAQGVNARWLQRRVRQLASLSGRDANLIVEPGEVIHIALGNNIAAKQHILIPTSNTHTHIPSCNRFLKDLSIAARFHQPDSIRYNNKLCASFPNVKCHQ